MAILLAVWRFHMETGIRVVFRQGPLHLLVLIAVVLLQPDPQAFLQRAARGVIEGGPALSKILLGLWALATAHAATGRLRAGLQGWIRHLPVGRRDHRLAACLALVGCQILPILAWLGLVGWGVALGGGFPGWSLLALGLGVVAAAVAAGPHGSRMPRIVGAIALGMSLWARPWTLGGAVLALLALSVLPDPRGSDRRPRRRPGSPGSIPWRISWKALGWGLAWPMIGAMLPVAGAWFVLRNNPWLSPEATGAVVRWGCGLAALILALALTGRLTRTRPPWGWSRSLPWSSAERVGIDVTFVLLHQVPLLAACGFLDPGSLVPVGLLSVYLTVRATGSMRRSADSLTASGWRLVGESLLSVAAVALSPWMALVPGFLVPFAWRLALRQEREQKVSRLRERRYAPEGDPVC